MTHEIIKIVQAYEAAAKKGVASVLVTVVALDGSSYRGPGVRMLVLEDNTMVGAVSGGCVEKEVLRQAKTVFANKQAKMMLYDGRYRLGCEGVLYLLLEPFSPTNDFLEQFKETIEKRKTFTITSYYYKGVEEMQGLGSVFFFKGEPLAVSNCIVDLELDTFTQAMKPCFKLLILGAEHDAAQLTVYAALTGWEVTIVATLKEEKQLIDFPGATKLIRISPESLPVTLVDSQTAVVLMTHSYVKDLQYLQVLTKVQPIYLGLLGPIKRREKLLNELMEYNPIITESFLDSIHGPAGLNIGAETPQEIAVSIIAEILTVIRKKEPTSLKNKEGAIHI